MGWATCELAEAESPTAATSTRKDVSIAMQRDLTVLRPIDRVAPLEPTSIRTRHGRRSLWPVQQCRALLKGHAIVVWQPYCKGSIQNEPKNFPPPITPAPIQ